MDATMMAYASGVFLAAGIVKGVSGMGLPTLSMALLGLVMPPSTAAALLVLPSLLTNIAQSVGPDWRTLSRRLWPMWLGAAGGTLLSPLPDLHDDGHAVRMLLGAVLVVYGAYGLAKPRPFTIRRGAALVGALTGLFSGALSAATGVFVMPVVPYLQALRLEKSGLVQALGLSFTVSTIVLGARLSQLHDVWQNASTAVVLAVVASVVGLAIGTKIRSYVKPDTFRVVVYVVFLLLGVIDFARAIADMRHESMPIAPTTATQRHGDF
jgi:uncharacterized protein